MTKVIKKLVLVKALKFILITVFVHACTISMVTMSQAIELRNYPKVQAVADELIAENYYTQTELEEIFAGAQIQQSVLKAMKSPAESKFTWGKYRKIFMREDRIQQGVDFWKLHEKTLARAEQEYGVPASIIVAIIGVESKFGRFKGAHKVLDSLVSLVVDFPRRSDFFAKELKQFLILIKENRLDGSEIKGSYAGAVGFPQFIASSYRAYAVDFNNDGIADLINEPIDAIGSVANYFVENGWLKDQPITSAPQLEVTPAIAELANRKRKVQFSAQSLTSKGAQLADHIASNEKLNVLMLDASEVVADAKDSGYYTVRIGDTACEIAERFNVPCKRLIQLNKLDKKATVFRDQRLKIPVASASTKTKTADTNKFIAKKKDASGKWVVVDPAKPSVIGETEHRVKARYFYTHENFYVITRYNHSVLYAMAVNDLSRAIAVAKRDAG